jgi:hypothetical protein
VLQDFSIVLLAIVDANYCFRYVNIDAPCKHSDGGIFNHCSLKKKIENNAKHTGELCCDWGLSLLLLLPGAGSCRTADF